MRVVDGAEEGVQTEGRAGARGVAPAGGSVGAQPPERHVANLKCFMNKFCHEMRHDLWR